MPLYIKKMINWFKLDMINWFNLDIIKSKWEKESIQIFHFKVGKKDTRSKKK